MNYKSRNQSLNNEIYIKLDTPKPPAKKRRSIPKPKEEQVVRTAPMSSISYLYGSPPNYMGQPVLPGGINFPPPLPPTFERDRDVLFDAPVSRDFVDLMSEGSEEKPRAVYTPDLNRFAIMRKEEEMRLKREAEMAEKDLEREAEPAISRLTEKAPSRLSIEGDEVIERLRLPSPTINPRTTFGLTELENEPMTELTERGAMKVQPLTVGGGRTGLLSAPQPTVRFISGGGIILDEPEGEEMMEDRTEPFMIISNTDLKRIKTQIGDDIRYPKGFSKFSKKEKIRFYLESGKGGLLSQYKAVKEKNK
jgi:hypothetical protein